MRHRCRPSSSDAWRSRKLVFAGSQAILLWAMVPQTIIMPLSPRTIFRGDLTLANLLGTIHLDKQACAVGAVSLLMLALTAGVVSAQGPMPPPMPAERQSEAATTQQQMRQMMDAMYGEGTSQRMHEAMGDDGEHMMDQCTGMMTMMGGMHGMMGDDAMPGMMGGMRGMMGDDAMPGMMGGMRGMMGDDAMPGMMGEPGRGSMPDMMRRMMGR